ncbi:Uncharacterised protein [Bordetella pertussis]|nr:Uncharacterised protein [Bordetella pertussis]
MALPTPMPSALLTASSTRCWPDLRSRRAISWSCALTPARASTRNTTTSASAMAWRVWRAISARMPSLATGSKPPVSITRKGVSPTLPSP